MITQDGKNLVFILSLPRSGSTLVSTILDGHTLVASPPEPWFLLLLENIYNGKIDKDSRPIYGDFFARKAMGEFLSAPDFTNCARSFSVCAYNIKLKEYGKRIFVDKTPRYYHILSFIDEVFPNAIKIWLKRNPLDIALSYQSTWDISVDDLTAKPVIEPYVFDFQFGFHLLANYFNSKDRNKIEIKYEDLISQPEKEISSVCSFLDILFEKDMLNYSKNSSGIKRLRASTVGDKKIFAHDRTHSNSVDQGIENLSTTDIEKIAISIGTDIFNEMGYEKTVETMVDRGIIDGPIHISDRTLNQFHELRDQGSIWSRMK